ncbi:MAG: hypothetical protein HYT73_01920 [Candidatus Aenigmarchaeota archaeon]|nr:hypothetical protein [Candidatus Aenigmarchaeota archaeon]
MNSKNKALIIALVIIASLTFLYAFRSPTGNFVKMLQGIPVQSEGEIEATILDVYNKTNPAGLNGKHAKISVDKVLRYNHNSEAFYEPLKENTTMEAYLQWGSDETSVKLFPEGEMRLPGVSAGDRIRVNIAGCPDLCNNRFGWTLYRYSKI